MVAVTTNIIRHLVLSIFLFWVLVYALVPANGAPDVTLLLTYLAGLLSFSYLLAQMGRSGIVSHKLSLIAILVFSFRVLVGVIHYLMFIDGAYFEQLVPHYQYIWDFEWMIYNMSMLSQHWTDNGLFSLPDTFVVQEQKNILLMPYLALTYYLGGNEHFLNVAVVNSLHNVFVTALVASYASGIASKKVVSAVFLIALLQPFGLFSSIMWRDSVGQLFLLTGAVMVFQYRSGLTDMFKALAGILLIGALRNLYILVGFSALFVQMLSIGQRNSQVFIRFLMIIMLPAMVYFYIYDWVFSFYDLSSSRFAYGDESGDFLKRIIIGLVGPFPWTQIFDSGIPGREYMLADILQAMFNLTVLYLFALGVLNTRIPWSKQPYITIIFLVGAIIGLGIFSYGHVSYVTVATVLLLPLIPDIRVVRFASVFTTLFAVNFVVGSVW